MSQCSVILDELRIRKLWGRGIESGPTACDFYEITKRCGKVKNQPPDLTAGEFNRGE